MHEHVVPGVPVLLAIDPGKDKCGVALVRLGHEVPSHRVLDQILSLVLERQIVPRPQTVTFIQSKLEQYPVQVLVMGHATTSKSLRAELHEVLPAIPIQEQDETGSTLAARDLYWKVHPPRGWRRAVPLSMQVPPEPLDDFAAIVLAARYLERLASS